MLSAAVVLLSALPASQRFLRNLLVHAVREWIDDPMTHVNQQVVGSRVKIQAKEIGEVAMVAQMICLQSALDFLVSVLAFTAIRVRILGGTWQYEGSRPVGNHSPSVGALGIGFALDDHPTLCRP